MNSRQPTHDKRHNVRVYGLLIRTGKLLVVDEIVQQQTITKFPGGGLEWGEGTIDCLIREFKEETGIDIRVDRHIYTTDFFQRSAFIARDQIISIYYQVSDTSVEVNDTIEVLTHRLEPNEEILGFRWIDLSKLKVEDVSLPIDQYLVQQILNANDELLIIP